MHPIFDKLAHVMRLAPMFTNASSENYIDQSWETCDNTTVNDNRWRAKSYGSALDDKMPFKNLPFINMPTSLAHGEMYTNEELWGLLDPTNGHLPYIYDQCANLINCRPRAS